MEKQKEYLLGICQQLSEYIDENGKDTVREGRFLDWPSSDNPEAVDAGVQALHILAVEDLGKIFDTLGKTEAAEKCRRDLERLRGYKTECSDSKQAAALMVLAGLKDAKTANTEILSINGAERMSTFLGYYILKARAMAGDYEGCVECIKEYWGGMLKLGATTFWEDFNIEWLKEAGRIDELLPEGKIDVHASYGGYCYKGHRHSFCHGWASAVTAWLSEFVLGVQIMELGCKQIKIEPHLGNLKWVEGSYPTPYGDIKISHQKKDDGKIESVIKAPEEVKIL